MLGRLPSGSLVIAAGVLAALVSGCPSSRVSITVRVQSGLRAEHEIGYVEARLHHGAVPCRSDAASLAAAGRALDVTDQALLGRGALTVTEFTDLAPGTYTIRARFRSPPVDGGASSDAGPVLVERCVVTTVVNDRVVRIALTSDCLDVTCPAPGGSPDFTECLNGRCVDPRCDPGDASTEPFCCDRMLLGPLCDSMPTLCEASSACTTPLSCSGPRECEGGVCVEPAVGGCPAGEHCSATTDRCVDDGSAPAPDAGSRDGGPGDAALLDASPIAPLDAATADGSAFDSGALDAPSSMLDGFVLDARAPPPDATRDAFVPPDASGAPGEDCTVAGDEEGDGAADCADAECVGSAVCRLGCTPLSVVSPPGDATIPTPAHWYRADTQVLYNGSGVVCAIRDIVDGAHFFARASPPRVGSIGPLAAIDFTSGSSMGASSDLGVDGDGGFTVFLVTRTPVGIGAFSALRTSSASGTVFFALEQELFATVGYRVLAHTTELAAGGDESADTTQREMLAVDPLAVGDLWSARTRYRRGGVAVPLTVTTGSSQVTSIPTGVATEALIASGPGGSLLVAEIIVYARVLDASEIATVDAYLGARY